MRLAEYAGRTKIAKNSPPAHHRTTLSGCRPIFATKECIDSRKNLLINNISSTRSYNMVNFGPLTAETGLPVWGTPANFNRFRVLAALLHGTWSSGREPKFAALNRGRSAWRPSRWALVHIVVMAAMHSRCGHYIFALWFVLFFPRLIIAVADWMSAILPHMVWP